MTFDPGITMLEHSEQELLPQIFAQTIALGSWRRVEPEDLDILKDGPVHPFYWDTWDLVVENARYVDDATGHVWKLLPLDETPGRLCVIVAEGETP